MVAPYKSLYREMLADASARGNVGILDGLRTATIIGTAATVTIAAPFHVAITEYRVAGTAEANEKRKKAADARYEPYQDEWRRRIAAGEGRDNVRYDLGDRMQKDGVVETVPSIDTLRRHFK